MLAAMTAAITRPAKTCVRPAGKKRTAVPAHRLLRIGWSFRYCSQGIFSEQFVPNGALVAFLSADHRAVAVPVARTHDVVGEWLAERNAFPHEVLHEALLRSIEEDLEAGGPTPSGVAGAAAVRSETRSAR
jgi:hypothetical protein